MALYDTIKDCVERLDRYTRQGQRIGEQNTKASLIEPVIKALGWDVLDPTKYTGNTADAARTTRSTTPY
ncbi:MAG: hypothetical protein ABW224_19345 [Kibdelosporangium sp.]